MKFTAGEIKGWDTKHDFIGSYEKVQVAKGSEARGKYDRDQWGDGDPPQTYVNNLFRIFTF